MHLRQLCIVLLLVPSVALSATVYLNGVRIDGVTNQTFDKAKVRIDDKGDVFIDAPGYSAKPVALTADASKSQGTLKRKYWLVAEQAVPGMTDYDIDVYVNSRWVRKLSGQEAQTLVDLTPHLIPGKNSVLFSAKKTASAKPRSVSREHVFKVMVGEGESTEDQVKLNDVLVTFERTAADKSDESREFTFSAR